MQHCCKSRYSGQFAAKTEMSAVGRGSDRTPSAPIPSLVVLLHRTDEPSDIFAALRTLTLKFFQPSKVNNASSQGVFCPGGYAVRGQIEGCQDLTARDSAPFARRLVICGEHLGPYHGFEVVYCIRSN